MLSGLGWGEAVVKRSLCGSCTISIQGVSRVIKHLHTSIGLYVIRRHAWFLLSGSLQSDDNTHDEYAREAKEQDQLDGSMSDENPPTRLCGALRSRGALCLLRGHVWPFFP